MKKINKISLIVVFIISFIVTTSFAQVAEKNTFSANVISGGLALTGTNSNNTTAGAYLGGSIAYGIGHGITLFAESGYGWTNINSSNNLELRQVPIVGGVTYNFKQLINSDVIQPYIGVAGGAYILNLKQAGNTIFVSGLEQNVTNFGLKGILGINFQINPIWSLDIQGNISHIFERDGVPGIESDEFNFAGLTAGVSFAF